MKWTKILLMFNSATKTVTNSECNLEKFFQEIL